MRSADSPCWNCAVRKLACQAKCEKYIAYKVNQEEIKKRRHEANMVDGYFRKAINRSIAFRGERG
jgi:hypothetical protein